MPLICVSCVLTTFNKDDDDDDDDIAFYILHFKLN